MIPGDIDLTENLDFRRTKRKEIKQLPDSWHGDIHINSKKYYNYINDFDNTSSITISSNNNIRFSVNDENTIIYNLNNSSIQQSVTFSIISAELDNNNYIITNGDYINTSTKYYITTEVKPELDVFGNKIIQEPEIKPIPWRDYKECKIKDIAWDMSFKRRMRDYLFIEDGIPWETSDDYYWHDIDQSNKFSISKAAEFISYLKGKSSSFIKRYLNRETEDNSSYLTNMNWIGVKDAIID